MVAFKLFLESVMRKTYLATVALLGLCGAVAFGNYAMTQGSGTNFGSIVVGGIHYAQQFICDVGAPSQCASVSSGGAVKVDGSAATQPVSAVSWPLPTGAATQASLASLITTMGSPFQAGGSIGNTTFASTQGGAWNITNISGTISLPTGAATAALQGTNSATTAHTCAIAGYSILGCLGQVDDDIKAGAGPLAFSSSGLSVNSILAGAQYLSTQPTITNLQQGSLLVSSRGELLVSPGASGFPVTLTSTTITGTVAATQSGTWNIGTVTTLPALPANQSVNQAQIAGTATSVNTGGVDAGTQRHTLASATPATPVAAAASDNHAVLKNGAGVAMSVHTSNNSATKNYLRLYDAGTGFNGCNSATGAIFAMEIPPTDGGFSVSLGGGAGIAFTNGLSWCITSGFGLTDTTNATASAIYANASYR